MKAIVVTDQAAGTAGMKLVEWPEPQGASLASLTRIERLGRDRTPSILGHELAGVVTALSYGTMGCRWDSGCSASRTGRATARWRST